MSRSRNVPLPKPVARLTLQPEVSTAFPEQPRSLHFPGNLRKFSNQKGDKSCRQPWDCRKSPRADKRFIADKLKEIARLTTRKWPMWS